MGHLEAGVVLLNEERDALVRQLALVDARLREIRTSISRLRAVAVPMGLAGCKMRIELDTRLLGKREVTSVALWFWLPARARETCKRTYIKFPGSMYGFDCSWPNVVVDPLFIWDDGKVRFFIDVIFEGGYHMEWTFRPDVHRGCVHISDGPAGGAAGRTLGVETAGSSHYNVL